MFFFFENDQCLTDLGVGWVHLYCCIVITCSISFFCLSPSFSLLFPLPLPPSTPYPYIYPLTSIPPSPPLPSLPPSLPPASSTDPFAEMHLQPEPLFHLPSDNVGMMCVEGTPEGRLFLGGKDGSLYEVKYQARDGWFSKKCQLVNQSVSHLSFLIPSFLSFSEEGKSLWWPLTWNT